LLDKSVLQFVDLVTLFLGTMIVAVAVSINSGTGIGLVKPESEYETVELTIPRPARLPNRVPVVGWDSATTSVLVMPSANDYSVLISARRYPPSSAPVEISLSEWVQIDQVEGQIWNKNSPNGESFDKGRLILLTIKNGG
jgi:hypothetical protein